MLVGDLVLLLRRNEGEGGRNGGEIIELCIRALGGSDGAVIQRADGGETREREHGSCVGRNLGVDGVVAYAEGKKTGKDRREGGYERPGGDGVVREVEGGEGGREFQRGGESAGRRVDGGDHIVTEVEGFEVSEGR